MPRCHIYGYPRPQMVRRSYAMLNGEWAFAFDWDGAGLEKGWANGIPEGQTIQVPFTFEAPESGVPYEKDCETVWYMRRHQFETGPGQRVMLIFEGVDHEADVWVNGAHAGSHSGGYARFALDITNMLGGDGGGLVVVRAHDCKSKEFPRGKQRWMGENYDCWYMQATGVWKSVWSETVGETRIERLKTDTDYDAGTVRFQLGFAGPLPSNPCLSLKTEVSFNGEAVYSGSDDIAQDYLDKRVDLSSGKLKWGVEAWSPGRPSLYDVKFTLYKGGMRVDRVESYFGVRKIEAAGGRILLNNHETYLRMVLDQGYWEGTLLTPPDEKSLERDLRLMLKYGYNGVRKHQKVEDERFYYWADVLGVLVWLECPAAYRFSGRAVGNMMAEWGEIVNQNYSHPSVIAWVPFNESWGVPGVRADPAQQAFTKAVYYLTKALDPSRPVVSNDGWEHTLSDILTLHNYAPDGNALRKDLRLLADGIRNRRQFNGSQFAWADGHGYNGQPIVLSEFGGIAFGKSEGWGYGPVEGDGKAFLTRFAGLVEAIGEFPEVCGYCYTQWTDVQQEVNGHLDMSHNEKLPAADVRPALMKA